MSILTFSGLLFLFSYLGGVLGAVTGLGGGALLIPILVLVFHVNIYYAMGASLLAVIATSSGASAVYLRRGFTNLRIGMFLEAGAVCGALLGAWLVKYMPARIIFITLGFVLLTSAYFVIKRHEDSEELKPSHPWSLALKLDGEYAIPGGTKSYRVQNPPLALGIMTFAGLFSGLLGIGSGFLKVLAMDQSMRLPYRVSTTTSNFMLGITAAAGVGVYFARGYINPIVAFPVLLGVTLGSFSGTFMLARLPVRQLRIVFCVIICILGAELIYKGVSGGI